MYNPQDGEETVTEDSHDTVTPSHTSLETSSYETPSAQHISTDSIQDLDLSNMTISPSKSSTPRPSTKQSKLQDETPSPYHALRQDFPNETAVDGDETQNQETQLPSTPGGQPNAFKTSEIAMTPDSSPVAVDFASSSRPKPQLHPDPLLHRVLDRNYRIQATPITAEKFPKSSRRVISATPASRRRHQRPLSPTLDSSPIRAPPKLHAEIFSSPERKRNPIPGVSIMTPARDRAKLGPAILTPGVKPAFGNRFDSDDDLDDSDLQFGASPPKTMQFHIPQSKLLKTPGTFLPFPFFPSSHLPFPPQSLPWYRRH